jgi:beta-galactosidase
VGGGRRTIGWQTDNEFGGPVCFCETCRPDSQGWLRAKYSTLDELNRAWGTHLWSHRYTTWGEIQIPSATGSGWRLAGDGYLGSHTPNSRSS